MQLYTRTGDKGQTRLIGRQVVDKDDIRVEAYGTIDELNSYLGVIISDPELDSTLKSELQEIQQLLFDCGSDLAAPKGTIEDRTSSQAVTWLEERITYYQDIPAKIECFILPGGCPLASQLHYARTVCRRAERRVVASFKVHESNENVLKFINRLSDYLFAVARLVNHQANHPESFYERSGRVFR